MKIVKNLLTTAALAAVLTGCSATTPSADSATNESPTPSGDSQYSFTQVDIPFESENNAIYGRALVPDAEGPVPTVVFSHGFGGNHEQEETIQEHLAQSGIAVYSFDFAGGTGYEPGQSEGEMTDMSVLTEEQNLEDALNTIQEQEFADPENIYLMGASQGGVVTTLAAEKRPDDIKGVYLLYPAFSLFDDARDRFPSENDIPSTFNLMGLTVGSRYFLDVYNTDIYTHMTYSGPVEIYHGDADTLVDISNSERAETTFPQANLTVVQGGAHGFSRSDQELIAPRIASSILSE